MKTVLKILQYSLIVSVFSNENDFFIGNLNKVGIQWLMPLSFSTLAITNFSKFQDIICKSVIILFLVAGQKIEVIRVS